MKFGCQEVVELQEVVAGVLSVVGAHLFICDDEKEVESYLFYSFFLYF